MLLKVRWRSLRSRIIAWSFVPTTIILLAVALVTFYAYQQVTEDLATRRNSEVTRLSASQMATDLDQYVAVLDAVARSADMRSGNASAQQTALRVAANRLAVFDAGVLLLNAQGHVVTAEPDRGEITGQDWSNRAYFSHMLRALTPFVSDVEQDGLQGADAIVLAVPVLGSNDELVGTLAGMFGVGPASTSSFYGGIVKLRIGASGATYVVDSSGQAIYHTDDSEIGARLAGQAVVQDVLRLKHGDLRTLDSQGRDIVVSFAPVPGTSWYLVTEERWAALMSASQGYRWFLIVLLALGVVVPALVVTTQVRRITGPIAELIVAAREVAGGRFGRQVEVHTGDELEELGRQFNTMSAELEESYAQLERRVAARTRELAALNAIAAVSSRSLDLGETLGDALDKTMEALRMEIGAAFRLAPERGAFAVAATRGLPPAEGGRELEPALQRAWLHEGAVGLAPTVCEVAGLPDGELKSRLADEGVQLAISIPLVAKGRVLGLIGLGTHEARTLLPEELSLLRAVGQQVGVAVENARLYEQAEQSAAAAERNRLARELHDAVNQTLFSASLIAEVLPTIWEKNPEQGRARLQELRQLTKGALAEMRMLLLELRPAALIEAPLGDLLRHLTNAATTRAWLQISLLVDSQCPLPPDVQVAFYRIAQEALNNVAKHSGASQAAVTLRCRPAAGDQEAQVELCVSDDGQGFDPGEIPAGHLGLSIMRERAGAIGASLAIASEPGHGTAITVTWRDQGPGA